VTDRGSFLGHHSLDWSPDDKGRTDPLGSLAITSAAARRRDVAQRSADLSGVRLVAEDLLQKDARRSSSNCMQVLHLSEHAAYGRIEAARAVRRFPIILERLERGELTLTAVSLLRSHLTEANCGQLLEAATHKRKRDVERLVAGIAPRPDTPAMVRKLPVRMASASERANHEAAPEAITTAAALNDPARPTVVGNSSLAPARASEVALDTAGGAAPASASVSSTRARPLVTPIAPERYKVQFTIGPKTHDKLRRAQDLLRHAVPTGDPAEIFDRALTLLVEQLEKAKIASATRAGRQRPLAPESRRVPAAVRRIVWARDEGRCAFVGGEGRCRETAFLEFHHVTPYARGGKATAEQIQLRCRAHNQYEAVEAFGARALIVREHAVSYGAAVSLGPDRVA
jgi:hypothetical protein